MNQDTSNAILRDLNEYFSKAAPDNPAYNQGLARTIIVRYGNTVMVEGFAFAWIGEFLQRQPSMLALSNALIQAHNFYGYVFDFVSARGNTEAQAVLAAIIQTSTDEDICAFAALTLASPHFATNYAQKVLQERYNRTEGTSCRMALALALSQCGDNQQLKTFYSGGYLYDYEASVQKQGLRGQELSRMVAKMLMPQILKIILDDVATDGRAFDGTLGGSKPWRRKRYS
jgi:hypothetical protein